MVIYQAYRVGWGKKVLGNGYTMLVATLGLFTVMHLGLAGMTVSIAFLPFILLSGAYGSWAIDRLFANKALQTTRRLVFFDLSHTPAPDVHRRQYLHLLHLPSPMVPRHSLQLVNSRQFRRPATHVDAWIICLA